MKSDARFILNKKKWNSTSNSSNKDIWRNRKTIDHVKIDARKILESKREKKLTMPALKRNLKTSSTLSALAKKEFASVFKMPGKQIELAQDGNIWITSQAKSASVGTERQKKLPISMDITVALNKQLQTKKMQFEPSTSDMDLEHTAIDDVLDIDSLPPALVSSKQSSSRATISHSSLASQVLSMKNTMVADQVAAVAQSNVKVYVTNLGPSVSKQDIMELFGDVGLIKVADMLQPGTAVIEFYNKEDADKACDVYHNRLLDGQPMKCYIQNVVQSQRSPISQRLGGRLLAQSISRPPVASVSSYNSRSRFDPRNVQFTVKL